MGITCICEQSVGLFPDQGQHVPISSSQDCSCSLGDDGWPWCLQTTLLPNGTLRQMSHAKLSFLRPQLIFFSKLLCSPLSQYLWQYPASCKQHHPPWRSLFTHSSELFYRLFSLCNFSKTRVFLPADVSRPLAKLHCPVLHTHSCPKYSPKTKHRAHCVSPSRLEANWGPSLNTPGSCEHLFLLKAVPAQ